MKVEIVMNSLNVANPGTVFRACPKCKSLNLLKYEGEVMCTGCDWDSIGLHVEAMVDDHCQTFRRNRRSSQAQVLPIGVLRPDTPADLPNGFFFSQLLREVKNG